MAPLIAANRGREYNAGLTLRLTLLDDGRSKILWSEWEEWGKLAISLVHGCVTRRLPCISATFV